jgi:TetR/AcrR family transcriptional regulator, mexJK operon transcriptional repressor
MSDLPRRQLNRIARENRILEAALTVFARAGYTACTMDAVAAEAGLSKPTLYQYFESKESLFAAMMRGKRDEVMDVLDHPSDRGMVADLWEFSWNYADTVLRPDLLSLARLIIGEVQRFPEIGRVYQSSGPDRMLRGIMDYLTAQRDAGRLVFDDAELAAQDLWGLILSAPRTQALYMPDALPMRADLERYIRNGLRVFLRAYSTSPEVDLLGLDPLKPPPANPRDRHDA